LFVASTTLGVGGLSNEDEEARVEIEICEKPVDVSARLRTIAVEVLNFGKKGILMFSLWTSALSI
jgi:hypothetical protein